MKKLDKFKLEDLDTSEKINTYGGDLPQWAMGYYLHMAWDFLTVQYDGDLGHLLDADC